MKRTRRLTSASSPDYAVLEASGQGIIVASDKPFRFVYDSESPPQTLQSEAKRDQDMDKDRDGECVRSIWLGGKVNMHKKMRPLAKEIRVVKVIRKHFTMRLYVKKIVMSIH